MKHLSRVVVVLVLFTAVMANAAEKKAARRTATEGATEVATSGAGSSSFMGLGSTILSPGITTPMFPDSGETAFGITLGVVTQTEISKKLYVGLDAGLHFFGKCEELAASVGNGSSDNKTGVQLAPTALYHLGSSSTWVPYLGLTAGPYLFFGTKRSTTGESGLSLGMVLAFRSGVHFNLSRKIGLNADLKYGSLILSYWSPFLLAPSLSLNIHL